MTQIHLSDAQSVILSAACAREDGMVFPVTASLKGGAVGNVCKSLLKRGLIEEIVAADPDTVWRHDADRGPITLRAALQGYVVLGITNAPATEGVAGNPTWEPLRRRTGSKQDILIAMLQAERGASIDEIATTLDWQHHTTRGFISGVLKKKLGLKVTSEKIDERGRVYRLS
jgi:hypothetical protein